MTEEIDARREDMINGVRQIAAEIDKLQTDIGPFREHLAALRDKSRAAGIPRLELAIGDACEKAAKAEESFGRSRARLDEGTKGM